MFRTFSRRTSILCFIATSAAKKAGATGFVGCTARTVFCASKVAFDSNVVDKGIDALLNRDLGANAAGQATTTASADLSAEGSWNVSDAKMQEAKVHAAQLGFLGDMRIVFLCAKDVDPDSARRPTRFELLMNPPNAEWARRLETLEGILAADKGTRDAKAIPPEISFPHFVQQHGEWTAGKSYVFFRDHPDLSGKEVLIQREQIFGTCAIHAPVVLQHYLVALANKGCLPTMTVDIARWIRKHAPKAMLDGIIFGNGTNADQVLQAILLPRSHMNTCAFEDIPQVLKDHGPVLLPLWGVTKEFHDSVEWQHLDCSTAPVIGHHAMIVVGWRLLSSGETRLLLQNWWHKKQFVEVDEAYYNSCMGCHALYVRTPQNSIPKSLEVTDAVFSVSSVDGAGVAGFGAGPVAQ